MVSDTIATVYTRNMEGHNIANYGGPYSILDQMGICGRTEFLDLPTTIHWNRIAAIGWYLESNRG